VSPPRRALAAGAVALALLVPAACAGGAAGTQGDGSIPDERLDGTVLPAAQQGVVDALALAPLRCSDLADRDDAEAAVAAVAGEIGLTPDDERWAVVGPALAAGIAANREGEPCAPQIEAWIRPAAVPVTLPTTTVAPTTTATAPVTTTTIDPAPPVDSRIARQARVGMPLTEVQRLFGSPGRVREVGLSPEEDDIVVTWSGCCGPFANVRVQVHDGTVTAIRTFNLSVKQP
jgi:hypothetical protein